MYISEVPFVVMIYIENPKWGIGLCMHILTFLVFEILEKRKLPNTLYKNNKGSGAIIDT